MPEMKIPGPDHPITIAADPRRLQVSFNGHVIADTETALVLKEAAYRPALYFDRRDVDMAYLTRTDRVTYCPYKGQAHYYSLMMDGVLAENAVWTYEEPYPAMELIRGRVAFYPNQVEIREVGGGDADAVREAILHTDDGAGRSQAEPWPPNVDQPA